MAKRNRAIFSIHQPQFYDGAEVLLEEVEWRDCFTDPLGSLRFVKKPLRKEALRWKEYLQKGNQVTLAINGAPQGDFLITTCDVRINKDGVRIEVEAKTPLCVAYEGCVDPEISKSFKADVSVGEVILEALTPYGYDFVTYDPALHVQALTGKPVNGRAQAVLAEEVKIKDAAAQDGEKAYAFGARLVGRLGFAIHHTITPKTGLLIRKPDYGQEPIGTICEPPTSGGGNPLIGDIAIHDTNDGQFSEAVVRGASPDKEGQTRASRPLHRLKVGTGADPSGEFPFKDVPVTTVEPGLHSYRGESIYAYKPIFKVDKHSRDNEWCKTVCHRLLGRAAESAYVLTGTVDGVLSHQGYIWTMDTTVHVAVASWGLDLPMWVLEVTKRSSRGGQSTELRVIPLNSLNLAEP